VSQPGQALKPEEEEEPMSRQEEPKPHSHYCRVCLAYWVHDCPEDECEGPNPLTGAVTDMLCPMHDGLPLNENVHGGPRRG